MRHKLVILLIAVIAACSTCRPSKATRLDIGMKAPSFVLEDMLGNGQVNSSKVFYYNRATVVVIWSMTCPTCRQALLEVQHLYEKYSPKAVAFLGINYDIENIQGVKAFVKGERIGFPMLWDKRARVAKSYRAADYTFSIFIVDENGRIALAQYDHPPDLEQRISRKLDALLKRQK